MGISERRIREKEELKELILKSAKSLFLEKGFEKTSIRNIADRIEYSPGIIYHYFRDKNEILHTLHAEGFIELQKRMEILRVIENPIERLKAMGKIYLQFGQENSDMYDLMFIINAPMDHVESKNDPCWEEGEAALHALRVTVEECMKAGHFEGHQLQPLSFMIWATVHGMVSLKIRKRLDVFEEKDRETIVEDSFQSLLKIIDSL